MAQELRWEELARIFYRDGSLRDIYVSDMSSKSWATFLAALKEWGYVVRYTEDGIEASFPETFEVAFYRRQEVSTLLAIYFAGVQINCHFFNDWELELDLDPREFRGQEQLDALVVFMERIGRCVNRPVRLTAENDPDSLPYLVYDPVADAWEAHLPQ